MSNLQVVIIEDKVFPVENDKTISLTHEEYQKYIDSDHMPCIGMENSTHCVSLYKLPYLSEYQPKTIMEIEGVELYDLSELSAGQIKNLLRVKSK